jgi:hypothetical protein
MKRIVRWLETKLSRSEASAVANEPGDSEIIKPDISESTIDVILGDEVASSMPDEISAKDVLMPDIYSDEHVPTVPNLKILNESLPDNDESTGFNPYDTATMHKK